MKYDNILRSLALEKYLKKKLNNELLFGFLNEDQRQTELMMCGDYIELFRSYCNNICSLLSEFKHDEAIESNKEHNLYYFLTHDDYKIGSNDFQINGKESDDIVQISMLKAQAFDKVFKTMNKFFMKFKKEEYSSKEKFSPEWMRGTYVQTMCDYVLAYLRICTIAKPSDLDNTTFVTCGTWLTDEMKIVLKAVALEALMKTPSCMIIMDDIPNPIYIRNLFNCEKIHYGI